MSAGAEKLLRIARPHLLRIVGPNCIGYMAPRHGLNASFGPAKIKAGRLAAIAQSGAVLAGLADWGSAQGIGFSHLLSMGDMADVDFGDLLDYAGARLRHARDPAVCRGHHAGAQVHVGRAQRARALKPVIVLKAGRHAAAAQAAASHTGALAGSDAVYDAAFARAGPAAVQRTGRTVRRGRDAGPRACCRATSGWPS